MLGEMIPTPAGGAEAQAFVARLTDHTHDAHYTTLIDALVADGVWTKLDILHLFATQNQTDANLNLKSTSYTATTTGSPTWGANVGYTTAAGKWVQCNWTPSANGVNYTRDNASLFYWSGTSGVHGFQYDVGLQTTASGNAKMSARATSADVAALLLNDSSAITTPASTDGSGFWLGNRIDDDEKQIWWNGSQVGGNITRASTALQNFTLRSGGDNVNAGNSNAFIIRAMGAGGTLTGTEIGNFYTRMAAFMTAIGATP